MARASRHKVCGLSLGIMVYVLVFMPLVHPLFHRSHVVTGIERTGACASEFVEILTDSSDGSDHNCPVCNFAKIYHAVDGARIWEVNAFQLLRAAVPEVRKFLLSTVPDARSCRSPPVSLSSL